MPHARVHAANLRRFTATLKARGDPFLEDLVYRALGGHPASLRACRRWRIIVGRGRRLPFTLGPIESDADDRAAIARLCADVRANRLTIRETAALLWRVEAWRADQDRPPSPFLALVHEFARSEGSVAKAAAAVGRDFVCTISEGPAAARGRLTAARRARAAACAATIAAATQQKV
ncbi:MAG: hypothetical protein JO084_19435 [Bradyrhizobiaceae bacterium]|nr:hypothetical protein [Bradyrhizobiaceae bacterium]